MGALDGRVALVTGSSRGIGAAIASLFAAEGAHVAVHGRDAAAVDSVRADIEAAGGVALGVLADLTSYAQVEAMREPSSMSPADQYSCEGRRRVVSQR